MIDLHTHTTFSDGTSTPEELLQEARSAGLRAMAITDHDTFAGFDAALPVSPRYDLELVCGLELTTRLEARANGNHTTVHLLAYFLHGVPDQEFRKWLEPISSSRHDRNVQLMSHLRKMNIDIEWSDLPLPCHRLGRVHFAKALVAKGYVSGQQQAFDRYLSDEALRGIERKVPLLSEGIARIRGAGGLTSLAHPVRLPYREPSSLRHFLQDLANCGLKGIEAYHSDHGPEDSDLLVKLAREFNLLITGGSDYHGGNKPGIDLGTGRGNLQLPYTLLAEMKKAKSSAPSGK